MSRKRRQQRDSARSGWSCLKCGAPMHKEISDAAIARAATRHPGKIYDQVEVCGGCGAYHARQGDGLRLLSDAECFQTRMETPLAAEAADFAAKLLRVNATIPVISVSETYKRL